jgi:GntR family transcriptional regulator of gluconate operon
MSRSGTEILERVQLGELPHSPVWKAIAEQLRLAIIQGTLPPGTRLLEDELAAQLRVSRAPIREALSRLAQEGLVEIAPRRGAFVLGMSEEDLHDLYGLRCELEAYAARLGVARATEADFAQLQSYVNRMEELRRLGRLHQLAEPDLAFHRRMVVMSGSRRLLTAWELTTGPLPALLSLTDAFYYAQPCAVATHQQLLDALRTRDPVRADQAVREHLARAEATIVTILRRMKSEDGGPAHELAERS